MKIYTRKGDRGRTKLFGGLEVSKHDSRVAAYGTLDELNASLGLAMALDAQDAFDLTELRAVQEDLFVMGSRLAAARPDREISRGTIPALDGARIGDLEAWIDRLDEELPPLTAFVLPGGCTVGAQLHVARTVCRRAEREVTHLSEHDSALSEVIIPYINRLSDLLFTLARAVNRKAGRSEASWLPDTTRRQADPSPTGEDEGDLD